MGTKTFLSILICVALISYVIAFPSKSDSDSDEDSQQQQQQNIDSDSLEQFTQKIQSVKGRRRKPEKVQVVEEPEPEQYEPCLESRKAGPCKAYVPRYFFNKATGSCELYGWGGCSKNGNNFRDLSDCETTCSKHLQKGKLDIQQPERDAVIETCEQPSVPKEGPQCDAYIPRWTYNTATQKCEEFIWGGCPKTANNFANAATCQATCENYPKYKGLIEEDTTKSVEMIDPLQQENSDIVESKNVCDLPSDPGLCLAAFERYYFNKLHNRCEPFIYGGCGGNKNRFDSAEECVRACGGDIAVDDAQCADVECPWALYDHYSSLGCSPIYDGNACCPTRFECSDHQQEVQNNTLDSRSLTLEKDETTTTSPEDEENMEITMPQKCRYRGKLYAVGEMVDEASDTGSCRAGCLCADHGGDSGVAPRIICAQIECPEHFMGPPQGKENCIPLYKKGACCAHDYYCPEGELTVVDPNKQKPGNKQPLAKCEVEGEAVYEGQRVYPDKSPCSKCLCQRNPANVTSLEGQLYCEKVDCGIEIHYSTQLARGCAPVYFEKEDGTTSCCPISWQCPDDKQDESENGEADGNTTPGTSLPEPPKPPSTDTPLPPPPSPVSPDTDKESSPLVRTREACKMEKQEGNCKGHRPSFFFNEITQKCEAFIYTGCSGNLNNFASLEDCKELCESSATLVQPDSPAKGGKTAGGPGLLGRSRSIDTNPPQQETKTISLTEVDPCTERKKVGRCKGYFPRFYYSPEDNECKLFIFGGCRPNANNFYSKDSCEATCLNKIPVANLRTNVPAARAIPAKKWRLDSEGGDASKVNFGEERPTLDLRSRRPPLPPPPKKPDSSEEENVCTLLPRTGRCKAFVRRFYYDPDKKLCRPFTYGGCSGNGNNFKTVEECNERCSIKSEMELHNNEPSPVDTSNANVDKPDVRNSLPPSPGFTARCKLPKASGSCHNSIRSYYYDAESKSCKLFFYSGCFGNANRFGNREDCENLCKKPLESEGSPNPDSASQPHPNKPQVHELGDTTSEEDSRSATPSSAERFHVDSDHQKEFCKEDPKPGTCNKNQLRYYYDSQADECLPFVYSGCDGNKNNFATEGECFSSCGKQPTLEQLVDDMVLSCSFGNETVPLGATVGGDGSTGTSYSGDEIPCGKPVCQCITPPSVTCVQRKCPEPTTTTTEKICATPTCLHFCKPAIGQDGCPTCDCDYGKNVEDVVVKKAPAKGVKG